MTLDANEHCDLYWDLADGIPFPDHSVTEIYSSHVFEHLPPSSLVPLLRDCYRALIPGGSLSVCVPDARLFLDAYTHKRYFVDQANPRCWRRGWFETGSLIDQINYIAYMGGEHRLMFDDENLPAFLRLAGFHRVSLREFKDRLDLPQRKYESIYAIGYKSD
ncbi:methyltransferase domain-containing protein [Synechococcus sp. CBW1004]|uniref:class I SAM-dependent methyltransferase n=1 Tax=Synechococcus sp. CBW1004 TaxID=1353136 RepID=UPI0018CFD639|nr:methyltransferase domain-containing protein [Synechococcus sp. CBW1004]QPN64329.1 methyltransferase domain-containing protein [Synechococcus sp. CBW1004]